jgi:hypothetical protein
MDGLEKFLAAMKIFQNIGKLLFSNSADLACNFTR